MTPVKIRKWLFSFPIPLLHQDGRETEDHKRSFLLHLSFILTHFCLISTLLHSLLHFYISFISILFCLISQLLLFLALCCLLSPYFCSLSVSLYLSLLPAQLHIPSLGSAALGLSLIIEHQNIFSSLFPGLCSPHLDHVILKSEGTAFAVCNESLFVEKEKRPGAGKGKAMSPTAEPAR